MKISWKIDGRSVNEGELGKELLKGPEIRNQVLRNAEQSIKRYRCLDHGDAVTVSIGSETARGFELEFDACCDMAAESAAKLVGSA